MGTTVKKFNWQRVARSAACDHSYVERLLDDLRRKCGKAVWTLEEITALNERAAEATTTWGAFCEQEQARW